MSLERILQVRVSDELAARLVRVADEQDTTVSELLRQGAKELADRYDADTLRRRVRYELAQKMTPWLHEELRGLGVENPEKYEVRYE